LFGEHQQRASPRLVEDALAVSREYLVCRRLFDHLEGNRAVIAAHQGQNLGRKPLLCAPIGGRAQYLQACKDSRDTPMGKLANPVGLLAGTLMSTHSIRWAPELAHH